MRLPYKGAGVALFKKIDKEYAILLGNRKYKPQAGKWSIPGGGYELKDLTLFTAAKRELLEETGLDLGNDVKLVQKGETVYYHIKFPFFEWKTYMYEVPSDFPTPTKIREFSEMKFIPLSELGNYKLAFGVKSEIKKFLKETAKNRKRMETLTLLRMTDTKLPVNLWIDKTASPKSPWLYFQNNYVDRFTCRLDLMPITVEEHPKMINKDDYLLISSEDFKKVTDFISNNRESIIKYIQDPAFGVRDLF